MSGVLTFDPHRIDSNLIRANPPELHCRLLALLAHPTPIAPAT